MGGGGVTEIWGGYFKSGLVISIFYGSWVREGHDFATLLYLQNKTKTLFYKLYYVSARIIVTFLGTFVY